MAEYIRRSLAEEAIEEYICRRCEEYNELAGGCISHAMHCPYLSGEEILKPVENENVQPVKKSKWCPPLMGQGKCDTYCERCHGKIMRNSTGIFEETPFCPHCGARMDGDNE